MSSTEIEQLFYVDNCLPGVWENDRFSYTFFNGDPRQGSFTDKEKYPKTGRPFLFFTFIENGSAYIRLVEGDEANKFATLYRIWVDCSISKMEVFNEGGQSFEFTKTQSF